MVGHGSRAMLVASTVLLQAAGTCYDTTVAMTENLFATHMPASPMATGTSRPGRLPDDLLQAAMKRLAFLCIVLVVIHTLAWVAWFLTAPEVLAPPGRFPMGHVAAFASIAVAIWFFVVIRRRRIDPMRLLDIGLLFEVFVCLGVSLEEFTDPELLTRVPTGISWVCWIIAIFPLLVPNTWRKAALAAFLSACTGPLAIVMLTAINGNPMPSGEHILILFFPNFISAAWAPVASRIVFGLGTEVERAREFGSYRLRERIGLGGMGEVWRATHRMLARPAAVKLIRAEGGQGSSANDQALLKRFEQEARATAALRSPHTVGVYDFGISPDGVFYYVMELLDGLDLDTLVKRHGTLRPERVAHLLIQVCHSLQEAHQAGLVHRDIKPANLFVCRYGADLDFAKVLDFGLVKQRERHEHHTELTQTGSMLGTPAFVAPEMLEGADTVDGRADLYALGCVAYWMLTGELVFRGDNPLAMAVSHMREAPDPPSTRSEIPIPEGLERIVMDCLAKSPDDRPPSARDLSNRVGALDLHREWTEERMQTWWDRHRPQGHTPDQPGAG
jgi:serine/threonine-protein kinase